MVVATTIAMIRIKCKVLAKALDVPDLSRKARVSASAQWGLVVRTTFSAFDVLAMGEW